MRLGGGSLFLKREGKFIGPGHTGIFSERGTALCSRNFQNVKLRLDFVEI